MHARLAVLTGLLLALGFPTSAFAATVAPRVLIVVAFANEAAGAPPSGEAKPWYANEGLRSIVATSTHNRPLRCNAARTVCLFVSGEGKVNALSGLLSLGLDPLVDLRKSYILVSGIAGVSPDRATVGTAAWARWIVDTDLAHEVDGRELPRGHEYSKFQLGCTQLHCAKGWVQGTEVYQLDARTVRWAFELSKSAPLTDSAGVRTYRARYPQAAARGTPSVQLCDTVAGDTYWAGRRLAAFTAAWTTYWTHGAGTYCMTAMEDPAYAEAVKQLERAGRADYHRFLDLRTGSDFDRQAGSESAIDAITNGLASGGFDIAAENGYRTARIVERYIVTHWAVMEKGVP
jgi:purine nucleoside permease